MLVCTSARLSAAPPAASAPRIAAADAPTPPEPPAVNIPPAVAPAIPLVPPPSAASGADLADPGAANTLTIKSIEPAACSRPRAGDDIWLISTRQLGCGVCVQGDPGMRFWHYENNRWAPADLKAFLVINDPHTPIDFYIHGNFNTVEDANDHGLTVYDQLVKGAAENMPIRFVIWSWPTDPGRHPVELIRSHAVRSDTDAWYLGWLLSQIDRRVPIGLAGYSFGSRVATGAIHLMGGGVLLGSSLKLDPKAPPPLIRAVLLAAAEDDGWLSPGAPNGRAIPTVDRMLLLNNSCDNALKHYPLLDRCTRASALGYVGLPTADPKISQCDACSAVGEEHDWANYFCNECLVARMRPYLYLAEMPAAGKSPDVAKISGNSATTLAAKP